MFIHSNLVGYLKKTQLKRSRAKELQKPENNENNDDLRRRV